jgi:hypothetical protein
MRLKVHLIANGRYYRAGSEIPEEEMPSFAFKYLDSSAFMPPINQAASSTFTEPEKPKPARKRSSRRLSYVTRNGKYVPVNTLDGATIPGEPLFWLRPKEFGQPEKFIKFASAK